MSETNFDTHDAIPAGDPMAPYCDRCGREHYPYCDDMEDRDDDD